jgi:ABC-type lipoprotein release transport system permease subunit
MTVVLGWLRLELRRRWRSLAVLALLVAISGAVVMTSLAAARRGASTLDRLHSRTLPANVMVLANKPGFDWTKVQALPEVAALTKFVVDYSLQIDGVNGNGVGFPPADAAYLSTIEKPVVFKGRTLDPTRADEAVVTRKFVRTYHKGVGDTVIVHLPSAKQLDDSFAGQSPTVMRGPSITVHIVGVVVSPWLSDAPDSPGGIQVSPGLAAKYPREVYGDPSPNNTQFVNALVRLKHGEADIASFNDGLARVTGRSDIDVVSLAQQQRDIQHHIAFESRCLLAFGAAAFVAALFLVGQAIARYAAASTSELQTLRALGMTPTQTAVTAAAGPAIVGLVGAVVGMLGAWFASSWFPYGTASYFESSLGRQWDWTVLLIGVLVIVVLVVLGAAGAARLAVSAARRGVSGRRSQLAAAVGRAGAGVPAVIGMRFALESGRGRTSVPVRPALIGAVTGVLGIVAAFTFSHGVSDAASHPERFGQTFQLAAFVGINGEDGGPAKKLVDVLLAQQLVTGLDDARTAVATGTDGRATVSLWEYGRSAKPTHLVVLSGRAPAEPDEVMLAPKTLASLHTHVGGTVTLTGSKGVPRRLIVTGSGLVPEGPHNGYADGGWIASAGYDSLFSDFKFHLILLTIPPGHSPIAAAATLATAVQKAIPEVGRPDIEPGQVPTEVAVIRQVRTLPIVLGGFLALLAIGAVGHALATAVRRRSHDLAVLRAVGMTQWQCRWVVVTQATVLALVGLVFGVPVGLAVGRTVWRVVANYTPIQYVPPIATWVLLLVAPAALVIANALAAWPGRRAARLRIASILRAE